MDHTDVSIGLVECSNSNVTHSYRMVPMLVRCEFLWISKLSIDFYSFWTMWNQQNILILESENPDWEYVFYMIKLRLVEWLGMLT
jgi:hypothetical protein